MKSFLYKIFIALSVRNFLNWMPDKMYIRIQWWFLMPYKLDLKDPKTFNEKLNWIKLHDRRELYTQLADKYTVRQYVASKIGEEYLIPLLGKWDTFDDIDFDTLPDKFVLKCNHRSRDAVVCRDKSKLDISAVHHNYSKWLKRNFYWEMREWAYKNIKSCIIAEELIGDETTMKSPIDYKFSCFNGNADNVMLCVGRETGSANYYFFDKEWNLLKYNTGGMDAPEGFTLPKPPKIDEMFKIAETLSEGIPYARVDLYYEQDKIYFGEITIYPSAGYDSKILISTDELFGKMIIF